MGRLSTRLSSRACVSVSIQCRSSKTSSSGCTWLSRSSTRLSAVERALAALRRVQVQKGAVVRQGVQERQQRREGLLEGLVQGQHLPRDLGPDGARVIAVVHMAVALEQVDDGEVGRGLAVGHRGALQHPPALGAVGVDTLIDQARLAHARLPHQGHHLAVARPAPVPGPGAAPPAPCCRPTKRRQAPRGRGLQAPAHPSARDISPNTGNTTPIVYNGMLLSMKEDSPPMRLDPRHARRPMGEWNFGGQMTAKTFTAHPKIDPRTGEMIAFSYEARATPRRISRCGSSTHGKLQREIWFGRRW